MIFDYIEYLLYLKEAASRDGMVFGKDDVA